MNVMIRLIRFLRNFPWKQTHLVVLGFLIWIVIVPFLEREERDKEVSDLTERNVAPPDELAGLG